MPSLLGFNTSATANTAVGISDTISGPASLTSDDINYTLGCLGLYEKCLMLGSTANVRYWIGFAGNTQTPNIFRTDNPTTRCCAFRYSTAAGDTTWQCVVTDGTIQVAAGTTVVPDATALHVYSIQFSNSNVLFYIDGTLVGTVSIGTTTLNVGTSYFNGFATVDNVGLGNDRQFLIRHLYWDTNP
jgi:hypothetical protein